MALPNHWKILFEDLGTLKNRHFQLLLSTEKLKLLQCSLALPRSSNLLKFTRFLSPKKTVPVNNEEPQFASLRELLGKTQSARLGTAK